MRGSPSAAARPAMRAARLVLLACVLAASAAPGHASDDLPRTAALLLSRIDARFAPVAEGLAEWLRDRARSAGVSMVRDREIGPISRERWPIGSSLPPPTVDQLRFLRERGAHLVLLLDVTVRSSDAAAASPGAQAEVLEVALRLYRADDPELSSVARERGAPERLANLAGRALEPLLPLLLPPGSRAEIALPNADLVGLDTLSRASEAIVALDRGDLALAWQQLELADQFPSLRDILGSSLDDARLPLRTRTQLQRAFGRMDTAWELLESEGALDRRDADTDLLAAAAAIQLERGELEDAERYVFRALQREPDRSDVLETQARVHQVQGAMEEAAESLRNLIERDPTIDRLERMARLFPEGSEERALFMMEAADAAAHKLQPGRARAALESLGFTREDIAGRALDTEAELSTRLLQPKRARRAVLAAIAADGETPRRLEIRALGASAEGSRVEATQALRDAVALDPENPRLRRLLGVAETEGGAVESGRAQLAEAQRRAPDDPETLRALAANATARGAPAEARRWLERADREAGAQSGPAELLELARVQRALGDASTALETLERANQRYPGEPEILSALEEHHRSLGDEAQAAGYAATARALQPSAGRPVAAADATSVSGSDLDRLLDPLVASARGLGAMSAGGRLYVAPIRSAGELTARSEPNQWVRLWKRFRDTFLTFELSAVDREELRERVRQNLASRGFETALLPDPGTPIPELLDRLARFESKGALDALLIHRVLGELGRSALLVTRLSSPEIPSGTADGVQDPKRSGACPEIAPIQLEARLFVEDASRELQILASTRCAAEPLPERLHRGTLASLTLLIGLLLYPFARGFGQISVVFLLPSDTRPLFGVRVSRGRVRLRDTDVPRDDARWRIRDKIRAFHKHQLSLTEGDRVSFRRLFARRRPYHVTMRGPLIDPHSGDLIGFFNAEKTVRVRRNAVSTVEFDMRPKQACVEVFVHRDGEPAEDARVALAGVPSSVRFAHGQSVILHLDVGRYRVLASAGGALALRGLDVPGRDPVQLEIDLASPDLRLFEGSEKAACAALEGDFEAAAHLLEQLDSPQAGRRIRELFTSSPDDRAEAPSRSERASEAHSKSDPADESSPQANAPSPRSSPTRTANAGPSAPKARSFGRYLLEAEIGRGGMGVVYRARDRTLERTVALKQLPEHLHQNELAVRYFTREARSAAALSHRNIVILFDAGREGHTYFLTMEYLDGVPLDALVRKLGPLSSSDAARLGVQIATGLQYAHGNHLVHRDIKASNLFLTRDQTLKIMDFGLAKVVEEVRRSSSAVAGTPHYMPPEQAAGDAVDARADLYALGVTLFYLCTATLPFSDGDVLYHHAHTRAPDPRERVPGVARPLSHLILQLLAKDPDDRIQTAAEVRERLTPVASRR